MDRLHDHGTQSDAPPMPTEAELMAALEEAEDDIAAGRTVPASEVLAEMDQLIEQMEARQRSRRA